MGEAPACFADDLQKDFSNGFISELKPKTATVVGDKTYVTGGNDDESAFSTEVRIFDRSTSQWISPVVLGTKPDLCKSCTPVLLDSDRILIVRSDSAPDDCFWFLEVDTQFIKEQKKRLETEAVAWSKGIIGEAQKPIVITGPSGVGKGTLISKLMVEFPSMFGFSVSHTTRAPRIKEKNGVHYHFTEKSVMEKEIKEGKFLEFAHVHDNLYGTSIEAVEVVADAGKRCILDIDVQGARFVRASSVEAVFIFIKPPSSDELEKRLRRRGTETEQQIQKRLQNARSELEQGESSGIFDHILINDDLDSCYMNLKEVLGLDGIPSTALESSVETGLLSNPVNLLGSKLGGKILVTCGSRDLEVRSKKFVLDVSCLKGGAPGRTRGIKVYPADSSPNGFNGMTEPS